MFWLIFSCLWFGYGALMTAYFLKTDEQNGEPPMWWFEILYTIAVGPLPLIHGLLIRHDNGKD